MSNEYSKLPPSRRKVRRFDWWRVAAEARDASPAWVLAYEHAPRHAVQVVNRGEADALQAEDGRFEAAIRMSELRKQNLFVRFIPYTDDDLMRQEFGDSE